MGLVHVEPVAWVLVAGAGAAYRAGVKRLETRGAAWPQERSAAAGGALLTVLVATTSPLAANALHNPTEGATAHILLLMVAPLLVCWSAPHLLAIEAGGRTTARRVRSASTSRVTRILLSAPVVWPLFAAAPAVVYLTSLYGQAARHEVVGEPVQLGLILIGTAFFWPIFGADPKPRRLNPLPAIGYLIGLLPYFTLLGMAVEAQAAGTTLTTQGRVAAAASVGNTQGAGGILWTVGAIGSIVLSLLVMLRWLRIEERATPGRHSGLDEASYAQLVAWRGQRAQAAAEDEARRQLATRGRAGEATPGG